jgi:hypothetical protein
MQCLTVLVVLVSAATSALAQTPNKFPPQDEMYKVLNHYPDNCCIDDFYP